MLMCHLSSTVCWFPRLFLDEPLAILYRLIRKKHLELFFRHIVYCFLVHSMNYALIEIGSVCADMYHMAVESHSRNA